MKKIIFYIITVLASTFIISGCSSSHKKEHAEKKVQIEWKKYSNEFFSIEYPSYMEYDEEINDMCDTIPAMSRGIRLTLYNTLPYAPFHTVCVQKSGMFEVFKTPEEWRDASVQFKQFDDSYIGTVESLMLDSLNFGGYPAAMAGFGVVENGDTLIHKQLVVMVGKELYYLNNSYDYNDDGRLQQLGDSILCTLRFNNIKDEK